MKHMTAVLDSFKSNSTAMALFLGVVCLGVSPLTAGDTTKSTEVKADASAGAVVAAAPATEDAADYKNWIEIGSGGLLLRGDQAQFKHQHAQSGQVFGGIEDMHIQQDVGKQGLFTVDGRAIFDNHDYNLKLQYTQTDLGYIQAGYKQFRTWYDGHGGYLPTAGARNFNGQTENELFVDRGEIWVEAGLRLPNVPEITVRYSHEYRDGRKDSTIWGPTTFTGVSTARLIVPAFRDVNEQRDIITGDANKTFGNTDVNIGMRYEQANNKDALYENRNPGQLSPAGNSTIKITQNEDLRSDLFSGHGGTVTRFNDQVWLTTGYSYTTLDSNLGGSRIYGSIYDPLFNPSGVSPQGSGFVNLTGGGTVQQHVVNLNIMWTPLENLTITPEVRIENSETNNDVSYVRTTVASQPGQPRVHLLSANELLNVAEGIEIRYTGIESLVLYARADGEQEDGSRQDSSNNGYNTAGTPLNLDEDTTLLRQKYTVGANWYPLSKLNFSTQYYHKRDLFSNDILKDDATSLDNQRMTNLNLNTDDVNIRATWKPLPTLSFISRYDYQYSTTDSRWKSPAVNFKYGQASDFTNQIFSECVTWNPFSRWYLQGNGAYVLNKTHTPATDNVTPNIIQDSTNDYYTLSLTSGLALDDKTDIKADYTYYRADNYDNNAGTGMPYGAGGEEHTASAGINRQISPAVRLSLKYAYYKYNDETSGGYNDYEGHMIYAGTQVKF